MNNILIDYMKKRLGTESSVANNHYSRMGPVVTISREYGCPAKQLASKLSDALDIKEYEQHTKNNWQWIGMEILEAAAKELKLKPGLIRNFVSKEDVNTVNDIVMSLSHKHYPGDRKIKRTLTDVIRSFAEHGHVIIVGRGGVAVTRDISSSIHIKLMAPLEWRINAVSNRQMITLSEARKKIHDIDAQRQITLEFVAGRKLDDTIFDLIFNYMTLDEEDIVATIIRLMESKDMI